MPRKKMPKVLPIKVVKLTKKDLKELDIDDEPGWYVHDTNNTHCPFIGAYDTKQDAHEGKMGQQKFWRANKWLLAKGKLC